MEVAGRELVVVAAEDVLRKWLMRESVVSGVTTKPISAVWVMAVLASEVEVRKLDVRDMVVVVVVCRVRHTWCPRVSWREMGGGGGVWGVRREREDEAYPWQESTGDVFVMAEQRGVPSVVCLE